MSPSIWRAIREGADEALLTFFWPLGVRQLKTARIIVSAVLGLDLAGALILFALQI